MNSPEGASRGMHIGKLSKRKAKKFVTIAEHVAQRAPETIVEEDL